MFAGNGNGWEPHLRATMSMYHRGFSHDLVPFKLAEKSRAILKEDLPLVDYESVVADEVISFRFLSGTILWLDIISSITNGTAPFLLSHHSFVFSPSSQIKLENIMGCKNRIMLQIGRISALREDQVQFTKQEPFDCTPFRRVVYDIDTEIQCELSQQGLEDNNLLEDDSETVTDLNTLVTPMFAYMASIYLHLVVHGFSGQKPLDRSMYSKAMKMLRTKIPQHILPALVCPLFIIGSVAVTEDEQYFREIFSSTPLSGTIYHQRARILPMLEEIWSKRQANLTFAWKDCLEITRNILLL
jgi:hypothetical protein